MRRLKVIGQKVVCIMPTRFDTQSDKVDLELWPRDPKSIGFLLSSSTMCMWRLKMCISCILGSKRGSVRTKKWHKLMILEIDLRFIKQKSYTKLISGQYVKNVGEKWGKLCIFSILSYKRGITPTKIDDTQTCSEVHEMKVIYKISAQYFKACGKKVRKTMYFRYSKF